MKNEGLLCHSVLLYPNKTVVGGEFILRDAYFLCLYFFKKRKIFKYDLELPLRHHERRTN